VACKRATIVGKIVLSAKADLSGLVVTPVPAFTFRSYAARVQNSSVGELKKQMWFPPGTKAPQNLSGLSGTTEVVPFPNTISRTHLLVN